MYLVGYSALNLVVQRVEKLVWSSVDCLVDNLVGYLADNLAETLD